MFRLSNHDRLGSLFPPVVLVAHDKEMQTPCSHYLAFLAGSPAGVHDPFDVTTFIKRSHVLATERVNPSAEALRHFGLCSSLTVQAPVFRQRLHSAWCFTKERFLSPVTR